MTDTTAVVTCFDDGAYVGEAVASLLGQEGDAPRVLVVDNGSTDPATRVALAALPDAVEVLSLESNAGPCAARNAGLARARTPLVLCLDADDRLAPGALRALRDALGDAPAAGYAYGWHRFFGDWAGELRFPPYDPLRLLDRHLIGVTALTRREVIDATGGFDAAFACYEDWELWLNALARGWRGVCIPAVTLEVRRHPASKLARDRGGYRATRRQLRAKHRGLYARRGELRSASDLGAVARLVYRGYWGPRPLPAGLEARVLRVRFGASQPAAGRP
jgi:glycosyltransferase involved in cell wall biosynthesis